MKTMSSTGGTMINGAFLQEVKDANVELWQAMHNMRGLINEPADVFLASKELVELLGMLKKLLGRQFALEETYGYLRSDYSSGINNSGASLARRQHQDLYLRIHELCEQAEEAQYRGTAQREFDVLVGMAAEFDEALRAHEELEAELISRSRQTASARSR